jgi:hypothetical protein
MICECEPHKKAIAECGDKEKYKKENFFIVPTKSGRHIICKPFNRQMFGLKWKEFKAKHCIDLEEITVHKDNPTILFVP